MNARRGLSALVLIALALPGLLAWAQTRPPAPAGGASPAIATVGARRIPRDDFERRAAQALQQFSGRGPVPAEMRDLIRRQMLETLIRLQLLAQEAHRTGITVSPLEAEAELRKDPFFSPGGQFDASRMNAIKTTQRPQYDAAIQGISEQLAARRLNEQLEKRMRPEDAAIRAEARRQLSKTTVDHLSLRRGDFNGSFPEPRETSVLTYYRTHTEEFQRPGRATLSVAFANTPGLPESLKRVPAMSQAWNRRMKQVADSLVRLVRGGMDFEAASVPLGGARPGVVVQRENFPGYWQGSAAQNAQVFSARPGTVLDPVPGTEGFLIVRVDDVMSAHLAPLAEVSREIRGKLRADARLHHADHEQRGLFASIRDSLTGPAWRFRYGFADTAALRLAEPSAAELDRYYRGHLADYSSFDAARGQIVARPLEEVRGDARLRWLREHRIESARTQADQLFRTWSANKRDATLETALRAKETLPIPIGADIDTGMAARAISDTVWTREGPRAAGVMPYARGFVVWQTTAKLASHTPTFEQARDALDQSVRAQNEQEELRAARKLFDRNPARFSSGNIIYFTRAVVPAPDFMTVHLTSAEVERFHRRNIDKYSAPELMRARHILISPLGPSAAADRAAREKAQGILQRLRAGEDFAKLARENSDDEPTRDKGGDLGTFGRGTMLDEFDAAAFALEPGQMSDLVRTQSGYHIILSVEHEPAVIQPLSLIYSNVSSDAATAKAETLAVERADSLMRVLRTVAQARAAVAKMSLISNQYQHRVGDAINTTNVRPMFERIEKLKAGELMRPAYRAKGQGVWIAWVDSITPPRIPVWEEARPRVIATYRLDAGQRALEAKKAELDSLFAQGWSLDSVAALWGGLDRIRDASVGKGLPTMSGVERVDSLLFGTAHNAPLGTGVTSDWLALPNGYARLRVLSRSEPSADQLASRTENLRREAIERRL
ncbi:MAG: peptidyl-prolyl cis-trans isomerase, partial [Candidatus Eisenbacteria bacterium]